MSSLRRSLFIPLAFFLLLWAGVAYGVIYDLREFYTLSQEESLFIGLSLFWGLSLLTIWWQITHPLNKIIREMKALLTGKPYRRVMTRKENEIGILAHFFNEITRNLENISGDVKTHARLRKEVDSAQDIQRMLLPTSTPKIPGLQIVAKTRPASEIGGDTFDFYQKSDRYLMYIGDSTGHGIPAALVMVMVDALLETFIDLKDSLSDILIYLNKYLKPHLKPSMFITMILLEWKPDSSTFTWAGGGHEYLIHVKTKEKAIDAIQTGGIAVGMVADNSKLVQERSLQLSENDFLVLYSDGIVEAKNKSGETYGLPRFKAFLESQAHEDLTAQELFEKIALEVGQFMQSSLQIDDMTLIVLKHSSQNTAAASTQWQIQ